MEATTKRGFLLAKGWIQAVLLVMLFFDLWQSRLGRAREIP